jgi:hypothetical protein
MFAPALALLQGGKPLKVVASEAFCFACFDTRLQKAASVLGMQTLGAR